MIDRPATPFRDALIQAGLSTERIEIGSFVNMQLRRDRGVEVLLLSNDIWLSGAVPQYGKVVSIAGTKLVMTDTIGRSEHAYTPAGGQVPNLL